MKDSKINDIFKALNFVLGADDKKKLAEVSQAYYITIDENVSLREENDKLKRKLVEKDAEICVLNEKLKERQKLVLESSGSSNAEYFLQVSEDVKIGPVCPTCYKDTGAVSVLVNTSEGGFCPSCKRTFAGVRSPIESEYGKAW